MLGAAALGAGVAVAAVGLSSTAAAIGAGAAVVAAARSDDVGNLTRKMGKHTVPPPRPPGCILTLLGKHSDDIG